MKVFCIFKLSCPQSENRLTTCIFNGIFNFVGHHFVFLFNDGCLFSSPEDEVFKVCAQSEQLWSGNVRHLLSVLCCATSTIRFKSLLLMHWPSQLTPNLVRIIRVTFDQNKLKSFRHGHHLENLFCSSSPEPKGQLTQNFVGSIGAICKSKITKIVPIRNPRWLNSCHLEAILNFFS